KRHRGRQGSGHRRRQCVWPACGTEQFKPGSQSSRRQIAVPPGQGRTPFRRRRHSSPRFSRLLQRNFSFLRKFTILVAKSVEKPRKIADTKIKAAAVSVPAICIPVRNALTFFIQLVKSMSTGS